MLDKVEQVIGFIRETRDDADSLADHIMYFVCFLMIAIGIVFLAFALILLLFLLPRFFIPLYVTIFILWQGYKRL